MFPELNDILEEPEMMLKKSVFFGLVVQWRHEIYRDLFMIYLGLTAARSSTACPRCMVDTIIRKDISKEMDFLNLQKWQELLKICTFDVY